ncbi:hypothetical protein FO519_008104 [Halicephalobus sp. NKZ332]|nr:hypothetical protein FO519_008104 [Halicephalobus sp. NKZ332]
MSSAENRNPPSFRVAGTSARADFNVNAGRDAFRNTSLSTQMDKDELRKQQFAMRSFTQSVEMDLPPAPELPATLDIDQYPFGHDSPSRLTSSSTADTIVEIQKTDPTLGETQKYPMTVPAPGHTDQEIELHKSLMRQDSDETELPSILERTPEVTPKAVSRPKNIDRDHEALRREYSTAAKQRPRPTTPTSMCTLDSYAAELEKKVTSPVEKIKVKIPRKSLKGKQPEDFYQAMQSQMPMQMRESLRKSIENLGPDGDILENIPEYKDKAPKAPVVHRRTSVEWENFEDNSELPLPSKMSEDPSPKPPTPPTSPVQSPTLEELYGEETESNFNISIGAAREEIEKLKEKSQTAEAFAEELFGGKSDEWEAPPKTEPPESVWAASEEPPSFGDPIDPEVEIEENEEKVVETKVSETKSIRTPQLSKTESTETSKFSKTKSIGTPQLSKTESTGASEVPPTEATEGTASENQDYAGYDQHYSGAEGQGTDQAAYDPSTYNYDQSTAYDYGENTQAYDYSQYGYDQSGNYTYDQNAYNYDTTDPNAAVDYSSYYGTAAGTEGATEGGDYNNTYNYDYSGTGYDYNQTGGYDYSSTAAYGAEGNTTTETTGYDYSTAYGTETGYSAEATTAAYGAEGTTTTETTGYDYSTAYGTESAATTGYDSSYYDTAQYGQSYSYGDNTDYSQYGSTTVTAPEVTATDYSEPTEEPTQSTATTSQFMQPVLPPMRARTPDPFSWEKQEVNVDTVGTVLPPPRPPPMAPSPEPFVEEEKKEEPSKEEEREVKSAPPRPAPPPARPPAPSPSRPPPPATKTTVEKQATEEEEDAWAKFKKMTENVTSVVKSTEEKIKELAGQSAAEDIKDESYLATVGGGQMNISPAVQRQMQILEEEKKKAKADKKKAKHLKKTPSKEYTQKEEEDMDKAAEELAAKLAARYQMESWAVKEEKKAEENGVEEKSEEADEFEQKPDFAKNWAGFGESAEFNATLPTSESDFFTTHLKVVPPALADDPFAPPKPIDPFAPVNNEDAFDPFDVRPAEDIVAKAKEKASLIATKLEDDPDYLQRPSSAYSSPTPEGGSPVSSRPIGFDDEFRPGTVDSPTPLYDEDDSQPLAPFPAKFTGDGWELMIRYPPKKKIMADRYWKPCFVKMNGNMLYIFDSKTESRPIQEVMLQPTYSLSDATLQAYDVYGKIHTVKLQCVQYKERIGIRAGQISRLVEGHITKYGMPIEHAAQVTVLAKFGCLNGDVLASFINAIEDFLFITPIKREVAPLYKQDEIQIHCYDEYQAHVDKDGFVSNQLARVRMFCLAFVSGSPILEIGLNDRRRQGKEVVRRKDILPMYTERWIRFENLDFHNTVDKKSFEEEQVVRLSPPDGVFFEICRFRVRPPKNREKPLTVKSVMRIAGSKIEIRIDIMAAAQQQRARGTTESTRTIPCEDICIRFPIPEAWIYIFREDRHWGVGSVHSKSRKPGKVKNLKDRLMGAVQHQDQSLIEVGTGEAKYEHVYRALVWRISRLPEKTASAYKQYMLKCRFDLSSFDLMPEAFLPNCDLEFTMPLATISSTVVRSVSVEQHEDSDRVEKFVRYVAKCKYDVEVDYVQCNDLDNDAIFDMKLANPEAAMNVQPEQHKPLFDPDEVAKQHTGYGIEFSESETGGAPRPRNDSSSDEEEVKRPVPIIEIDMKGYGY